MPVRWQKMNKRAKKWLKINAFMVGLMILATMGIQEFHYAALQISAVLFGVIAGYYKRKSSAPINYMMTAILIMTVAIAMQPEFFRFGQLAKLGLAHLAPLALAVSLAAMIFVFRNFTPTGFIRDNHYKYIKWFMRLSSFLMLMLFVMTEAVPALIGLWAGVVVTAWFAVKHSDGPVFNLSGNLWALLLMVFGVITVMPLFTILGILCWKNNNIKAFWRQFYDVIK
jgi:hypothetical protein